MFVLCVKCVFRCRCRVQRSPQCSLSLCVTGFGSGSSVLCLFKHVFWAGFLSMCVWKACDGLMHLHQQVCVFWGVRWGSYWAMKQHNKWTCEHTSSKTNSSTSSKVSSSLVPGNVTAARAVASLLLTDKPLQDAWRHPKEGMTASRGANINMVCYPIREIKHVNPSFNCWVFWCLNSGWLQAAPRQMELKCASKSSISQWTWGSTLRFKSSRAGILEVVLLHFFGIWLITV